MHLAQDMIFHGQLKSVQFLKHYNISIPQVKELCIIIARKQIPYFLEKRSGRLLQTELL